MSHRSKYFLITSSATVIASVATYISATTIPGREQLAWPLVILCLIFGVISSINGAYLFAQVDKRPQSFIRAFMGSFTLKFLINLIILATYLYNFPIGRIMIVVVFFSLFVFFTVAEKSLIFKAFRESESD